VLLLNQVKLKLYSAKKEAIKLTDNKIYKYWNGKNINGQSSVGSQYLIQEGARSNTKEMKYEVGVDTFSADDLQAGVDYDNM